MKTIPILTAAALCFAMMWTALPLVGAEPPPAKDKSGEQVEADRMAKYILAKRFCVALRRNNLAELRTMIDPRFLEAHGIAGEAALPIEIAPVFGIYHIGLGSDNTTALCLYQTGQGKKEAMILKLTTSGSGVFVAPANPPDPSTGKFQPWVLRTDLDGFAGGEN